MSAPIDGVVSAGAGVAVYSLVGPFGVIAAPVTWAVLRAERGNRRGLLEWFIGGACIIWVLYAAIPAVAYRDAGMTPPRAAQHVIDAPANPWFVIPLAAAWCLLLRAEADATGYSWWLPARWMLGIGMTALMGVAGVLVLPILAR